MNSNNDDDLSEEEKKRLDFMHSKSIKFLGYVM